jgi:SAM-dependent methyltransferase
VKRTALDHLICPATAVALQLEQAEAGDQDEVLRGTLTGGARPYPIEAGIPSFVPEEVAADQTVRSFAQKWSKHRYYRSHTERFYTDWYVERYDFGDVDGLRRHLEGRQLILDAGTGTGRDAANFAKLCSATVFGVDTAWDALDVAREQVDSPNVAFVHADINHLPFADESFDFINCDQVIHHTPDPRATFEYLRTKLKTGGEICCYVYRKKSAIREFVDDYVRERLSQLPIDEALEVSEGFTKLGHAFAKLGATVEIEEDIDVLGIRKGTYDVQRFLHYNVMKCFWNDEFDFFTNNIVNFDWYHPLYCFRYEPEQFRAWFDDGWRIESWDVREAGLSCRATKR